MTTFLTIIMTSIISISLYRIYEVKKIKERRKMRAAVLKEKERQQNILNQIRDF